MRTTWVCLLCIWAVITAGLAGRAADFVQEVPDGSPAYEHLQSLITCGILSSSRDVDSVNHRALTRFDVGLMLIEPLQRLIALADEQESPTTTPEQRRRADLALHAVSPLTEAAFNELLSHTDALRDGFRDVLDSLSPGLAIKAANALNKLAKPQFRIWLHQQTTPVPSGLHPIIHTSIGSNEPESFGLLPLLPTRPTEHSSALPMLSGEVPADTSLVITRPIHSLDAAFNVFFGSLDIYGKTSTMPGADFTSLLKPDANRTAMLGMRVDFGHLNDLGFAGIFEYHIMRTGDPANPNIDQGVVTGFGLTW